MLTNKKILIVDDERIHLNVMVELLGTDCKTLIAKNGKKALEIARAEMPDLILLDIVMPEMDGYEVCQALKADSRTKDIAVLFLTVKSDVEDEKRGFALGAVDYITKPFSPPIVRARISTHLKLGEVIQQLSEKNASMERAIVERNSEIQQRKKVEQELLSAYNVLKQAKMTAEEANLSKSIFVSSLSHELRTPLNAIIGFSDLLRDKPGFAPDDKAMLQHIFDAGNHLESLTSDLLDLAQLEAGKLDIQRQTTRLSSIIEDCLSLISLSAQEKHITIETRLETMPVMIKTDPVRLKQVILNLLSNAIKYNVVQGSITIEHKRTDNNRSKFMITDTGVGMTEAQQAQLFTYFERAGAEQSDIAGTGIGLALSKGLIEAMDGELGVSSSKDHGTTFWISLPTGVDQSASIENSSV